MHKNCILIAMLLVEPELPGHQGRYQDHLVFPQCHSCEVQVCQQCTSQPLSPALRPCVHIRNVRNSIAYGHHLSFCDNGPIYFSDKVVQGWIVDSSLT